MTEKYHKQHLASFTLIELLGVMSIIVMMTVVGMSSYIAVTRGAALRSGVDHVRQTLMLSRQTAILKSKSAKIYFDKDNASFIACLRAGTVTGTDGTVKFFDRYANLDEPALSNGDIFRLPEGQGSSCVKSKILRVNVEENSIETADPIWALHDEYGWEICPEKFLPPGIIFESIDPDEPVVYNSKGETTKEYTIKIREKINPNYRMVIVIRRLTGFIEISIEKGP